LASAFPAFALRGPATLVFVPWWISLGPAPLSVYQASDYILFFIHLNLGPVRIFSVEFFSQNISVRSHLGL
jgi:hypothetical protein